mgnify:CR=1 FL=1
MCLNAVISGCAFYRAGISRRDPGGIRWIESFQSVVDLCVSGPIDRIWAVLRVPSSSGVERALARRIGQTTNPAGTAWETCCHSAHWSGLSVGNNRNTPEADRGEAVVIESDAASVIHHVSC